MDRLALTGFTLMILGAIGILASELVGTAHAGRAGGGSYFAALSSGSSLRLMPLRSDIGPEGAAQRTRVLACQRMVDVGGVSVGLRCSAR